MSHATRRRIGSGINVSSLKRLTYECSLTKICLGSASCNTKETAKTAKPNNNTNTSLFRNITYAQMLILAAALHFPAQQLECQIQIILEDGCTDVCNCGSPTTHRGSPFTCLKADMENRYNRETRHGSNVAVEIRRRNR
jgi:hypothetical protein